MMKKLFAVLTVSALLSACGEKTPVQTVDWYKEHDTERQELLAKCRNDRKALDNDPNCLNAEQAQISKESSRRGWIKPKLSTSE